MQRKRRYRIVLGPVGLLVLAAPPLLSQVPTWRVGDPEKKTAKLALRHIRLLELPSQRASAAAALLALGEKAVPSVVRCLDDPRPEVIARLMLVLRAFGDHARLAIPALKKLVKSEDKKIARAARWGLSQFEPEGVMLITESGGSTYELDADRKVRFRLPDSKSAYDAERLPNGNYLVSILNKQLVHEIDRKGKVVWKITTIKGPTSATRLPSGNTLICSLQGKQVVEVNSKGRTVWHHKCNTPYSAQRLANGNTLIADYSGQETFEVTLTGKRVWTYDGLKGPLEAHRLSNGNTLITSHSQRAVHEVTPKGRVVLKIQLPSAGWSGIRLPNGDTVVGGGNYLVCYDSKGKERWKHKGVKTVTSVRYY